jgi:hypothetical protein
MPQGRLLDEEERRMTSRPYKVLVVYKSGAQVKFKCSEFTIDIKAGTRSVTWKDAKPNPLMIGVDEIAAVWDIT